MPINVAIDRSHSLGLGVIKRVKVDRVVADAGADSERSVWHRLAVLFQGNGEVGHVAVGTKNKRFLDLDTVLAGQRKLDRLLLARIQSDRVLSDGDLIIAFVGDRGDGRVACR